MSNVAYKIDRRPDFQEQHPKKQVTTIAKKGGISIGEVILLTFLAIGIFLASVYAIANYATIYSVNKDIQEVQEQISSQSKEIEDLQLQVTELSEPERILDQAKKQGMVFNEKNVKLVNE